MIKLTQEREITPYPWVHPDDDDRRQQFATIWVQGGAEAGTRAPPEIQLVQVDQRYDFPAHRSNKAQATSIFHNTQGYKLKCPIVFGCLLGKPCR